LAETDDPFQIPPEDSIPEQSDVKWVDPCPWFLIHPSQEYYIDP
jgi:hypothetical protein